jgi:hypothetical protein
MRRSLIETWRLRRMTAAVERQRRFRLDQTRLAQEQALHREFADSLSKLRESFLEEDIATEVARLEARLK